VRIDSNFAMVEGNLRKICWKLCRSTHWYCANC